MRVFGYIEIGVCFYKLIMLFPFSGRDPATDLRGVGLLGLLHLVYLLRDAKRHVLASEIYKLSLHPTQVVYKLYSSWNSQQKYITTI